MIHALIVAAGQGTRMGGDCPKQFLNLAGRPVIAHSLLTFDRVSCIDRLVLVAAPDQMDRCRHRLLTAIGLAKPLTLVKGGRHRRESVYLGLQAIEGSEGIVLIHDGVRPLVSSDLIEACVDGARRWGACIPGVSPVDTIKTVSPDGWVRGTASRDNLRQIQTPQAFDLQLIRRAHDQALREKPNVTDDAALVERLNQPVKVIPGDPANLKITTPHDLGRAELILASMR